MSESSARETVEPPVQPLFDAESTRKVIVALARATAASLASGIAISSGEAHDVDATLRIQKEVYDAFASHAYRDPSLPPLSSLAQEEPVTKLLSAINRFGAAAIASGVMGSSDHPYSVGAALRVFYEVTATMWPREPKSTDPAAEPAEEPAAGHWSDLF